MMEKTAEQIGTAAAKAREVAVGVQKQCQDMLTAIDEYFEVLDEEQLRYRDERPASTEAIVGPNLRGVRSVTAAVPATLSVPSAQRQVSRRKVWHLKLPEAPRRAVRLSRRPDREVCVSNGLKEFLYQLEGIGRGHLLDLGAARQTTITLFIERGFKVYTEDLVVTWKNFLDAEEKQWRELPPGTAGLEMTPAARVERFLETALQYPPETFDAVLLWDLLDYLDGDLVSRLVARITSLVRDGGVAFAIFHERKPEAFHRYRVVGAQNLEPIPASCPFTPQRVFQNREISDLFPGFRSSRTFVGRDQLRESLFIK